MTFRIIERRPNVWLDALIATGCLIFMGYVLWAQGYISQLLASDKSYLSLIIIGLFLISTVNWLNRCRTLGQIQRALNEPLEPGASDRSKSVDEHYLRLQQAIMGSQSNAETSVQLSPEQLADHLLNPHAVGYFIGDLLLKLGLMGTIIGFILMLQPIAEIRNFETTMMQQLLTAMSGGMAIALYTTLAGLVTSTLVKGQYHLADQSVVHIVSAFERLNAARPTSNASPQS